MSTHGARFRAQARRASPIPNTSVVGRLHGDENDLDVTLAEATIRPQSPQPDEQVDITVTVEHTNFSNRRITGGEWEIIIEETGASFGPIPAPDLDPGESATQEIPLSFTEPPEDSDVLPSSGPLTVLVQAPAQGGHKITAGAFRIGSATPELSLVSIRTSADTITIDWRVTLPSGVDWEADLSVFVVTKKGKTVSLSGVGSSSGTETFTFAVDQEQDGEVIFFTTRPEVVQVSRDITIPPGNGSDTTNGGGGGGGGTTNGGGGGGGAIIGEDGSIESSTLLLGAIALVTLIALRGGALGGGGGRRRSRRQAR